MNKRGLLIFLSASVFQRAVPFLLLPLFTRTLGPSDYGFTSILASVFVVTGFISTLGQEVVFYRYGPAAISGDPVATFHFRRSAFLVVLVPAALAIVALVISIFLASNDAAQSVLMSICGASLSASGNVLAGATLRIRARPLLYAAFVAIGALITGGLKVYFIVFKGYGFLGWAWADALSGLAVYCAGGVVFLWIRRNCKPVDMDRGDGSLHSLSLGVGTLPGKISQWVTGLSDRMLLATFVGLSATGQFALASQLIALGMVLINEISRFILPQLNSVPTSTNQLDYFRVLLRNQSMLFGGISSVLAISMGIAPFVFGERFAASVSIGTWLCGCLILTGVGFFLNDVIGVALGTPMLASKVYALAALISVTANLILMPVIGVSGAIVSQYLALSVTVLLLGRVATKGLAGRIFLPSTVLYLALPGSAVLTLAIIRSL